MNDQPYLTQEEHERYQRARIVWTLELLFYLHLAAYVITNGVFLILFGRVGLWWGVGLVLHGVLTFAFGTRLALWIDRRIRTLAEVEHR